MEVDASFKSWSNKFSFAENWYDIGSFPAFLEAHQEILGNKKVLHPSLTQDKKTEISGWACIEKNVILENGMRKISQKKFVLIIKR